MRAVLVVAALLSQPALAGTVAAASCSQADVQAAISAAVSGDTVTTPGPCSASWSSRVSIPAAKALTLQGGGNTTLTHFGFTLNQHASAPSRITGFVFTDGEPAANDTAISVSGNKASSPGRIDHNVFRSTSGSNVFIVLWGNAPFLIDHNTFTVDTGPNEIIHNAGMGPTDASGWSDDVTPGGPEMVFIEDNTFTYNATGNPAYFWGASAVQSYYGARTVFRHNTLKMMQVDQHGTAGMIGARWWEVYENTFDTSVPNASQCCFITMRGGSGVIFDNHRVGANATGGSIDLYEEDTGYPALYQVGRGKNQTSTPAYVWGNASSLSVGSQTPSMVQANRDYFLSAKPGYTPYVHPHPLQAGGVTPPGVLPPTGLSASVR